MATASSKSSKNAVGKHSKVRPKAESRPSGDSKGAKREKLAHHASILLKYVSDPTRLEVVLILAEGEEHIGSICAKLSQSQTTLSHHLALLRYGQIIIPRRAGANNFYRLTDAGCVLAGVGQRLLNGSVAEKPVVATRPIQTGTPRTKSPKSTRERSIDSQMTPDPYSDGIDEESWSRMNRRRAELIFKNNRGPLNDEECSELERLQVLSVARIQRDFPGPTLIDERLKRIEARLRGGVVEKA